MQDHAGADRQVLYNRPGISSPEDLASLVQEAKAFCERHNSPDRWLRILFVFEPRASWRWLSLPTGVRDDLENRCDAVTFARPWDLVGVRRRLAQHEKMHSDEVCQQILDATGGWHFLLRELFARCGDQDDPRPFAEELELELLDQESQLRQSFHRSLGLGSNDAIFHVLHFVHQMESVLVDLVTPDLIECESELTDEECSQAVEFLQRMACVISEDDLLTVDPIVSRLMPVQ